MQTHGQHARRRRQYTTSQVFSFMRVVDILLCCSFRLLQGEYGTAPRGTLWNVFNVAQDGALLTYLNTSSLSGKMWGEKKRRRKKRWKKKQTIGNIYYMQVSTVHCWQQQCINIMCHGRAGTWILVISYLWCGRKTPTCWLYFFLSPFFLNFWLIWGRRKKNWAARGRDILLWRDRVSSQYFPTQRCLW